MTTLGVAGDLVDILEVAPQVAALSESLVAHGAGEGPLTGVLAEVVPQVAALLENTLAASMLALEVELDALSCQVFHLDSLVPVARNALEGFGLDARDHIVPVRELRAQAEVRRSVVRVVLVARLFQRPG